MDVLARSLTELGLATGDRVVILRNCPEFVETLFACWKLGLVSVPVWGAAETLRNTYGKVLKRELRTAYSSSPENTGPYS